MAARLTDLVNEVEQLKEENDKLKENNPHLLLQGIYFKIFDIAIVSLVSLVATELVGASTFSREKWTWLWLKV